MHTPFLNELALRDIFLSYFNRLGFERILDNNIPDVPMRLAKEFFTSLRFKAITDLDVQSITFPLFGFEVSMGVTEWTARLGICTIEEALSYEWRGRERGIPCRHVEFDSQTTWESLTHCHARPFVAAQSRSNYFSDPVLGLVHFYLDYNLIGQTNSSARTSMTELYLLWYAKNGTKLHLGFWTAYLCHLVATHPARNLSICNVVGMFVRNSVVIQALENTSPIIMVDMPGLFDISFFVKTGMIYLREGVPEFL